VFSVALLTKTGRVEAFVNDHSHITAQGNVSVNSSSSDDIYTFAVGGAGADTFALGGSIADNKMNNITLARVYEGAAIQAAGTATIRAVDDSTIDVLAAVLQSRESPLEPLSQQRHWQYHTGIERPGCNNCRFRNNRGLIYVAD